MMPYGSPSSIPLKQLYEMASAYMEQYGEYVGNFLLGAIRQAMDDGDKDKAADWFAICDCVEDLNGGPAIIQRDPPNGKDFTN